MRVRPEDIELSPWVGAPIEDQSEEGRFRREVAELTREVLADFANHATDGPAGRPAKGPAKGAANGPANGPARRPHAAGSSGVALEYGRAEFDLSLGTAYHLVRAFRRLHRRLGAARGGGDLVEQRLLLELARTRPADANTLRRSLNLPASTFTGIQRRLIDKGLAERTRHPGDRRMWRLRPTAAGLAESARIARAWRAADDALLSSLSAGERDDLRRLLKRAAGALR